MWTFDRFEPGALVGSVDLPVLEEDVARWMALFPSPQGGAGDRLPAGFSVAMMMKGYMRILDHRPPGNVHAHQSLVWGPMIRRGGLVSMRLVCLNTEMKSERRWITFDARLSSMDGVLHLSGEMRMLWAR